MSLIVTQPIRPWGSSFSKPWLVKCNDDQQYILKFFNGTDNSLANEYICGQIAMLLELPIAKPEIIFVGQDEVDIINAKRNEKIKVGHYVGTEFLENSYTLNKEQHTSLKIDDIQNIEKVPGMIVYDIFTDNTNRCEQNALLHAINENNSAFEYIMIDHGHSFSGPDWNEQTIKKLPIRIVGIPWKTDYITGESSFKFWIEKLKTIDRSMYKNILDSVHKEWKPRPNDFDALLETLVSRSPDEVLNQLKVANTNNTLFGNWRDINANL